MGSLKNFASLLVCMALLKMTIIMYKTTNDDFLLKRLVSKLSIVKRQITAVCATIAMATCTIVHVKHMYKLLNLSDLKTYTFVILDVHFK